MEFRDFAYWLQGFFEINNPHELTAEQTKIIKMHLQSCFNGEVMSPKGEASLSPNGYTCGTSGVEGHHKYYNQH